MNNENSEQLIFWPRVIMILAGLWNQPVSKNRLVQNAFSVYSIFMRSTLFLCCFLVVAEFVRLVTSGYPSIVIMTSLSVAINTIKIPTKVLIYMKNNVLEMFKDLTEKECEIWALSKEVKKLYTAYIRILRLYVAALVTITAVILCFVQIIGGIATVQIKRHNEVTNETLESHFMLMTLYPRDKLANLKLTFATQVLWTWLAFTSNCVSHTIFLSLLVYSVARLEVLQVRLRAYIEPDFRDDPSEEEVKGKVMVLKTLIDEHKYIIRFIEHLNECTKNIVLMEFVLSSLDISAVSVSIIKIDSSQIAWQILFFVLLACQIFFLGWTCNEIKVQSEAIADAAYESRWYLLNKDAKQLTLTMMARAQKPLVITIGSFGPMTIHSAILIMKAAYSYVSIMRDQ